MININLCDYSYLNSGSLYRGINCSLILNGVMDKTYAETYIMFLSLVRNYSGVGLSKLGEVYRQGATYPVYMEVCYTRRTLNNMFKSLQTTFTGLVGGYLEIQKQSITSLLWNALYIIPS